MAWKRLGGLIKTAYGKKVFVTITIANNTNHPIVLNQRIILGHLQTVKALYPAAADSQTPKPVFCKCSTVNLAPVSQHRKEKENNIKVKNNGPKWDPPVNVDP